MVIFTYFHVKNLQSKIFFNIYFTLDKYFFYSYNKKALNKKSQLKGEFYNSKNLLILKRRLI